MLNKVPDHIWWSVDNKEYAFLSDITAQTKFKFKYNTTNVTFDNMQIETTSAIQQMYAQFNKPLAICISGKDSEVIAREAAKQGIPFTCYFLNLWDINIDDCRIAEKIAKEINREFVSVTLTRSECLDSVIFDNYELMHIRKPTYLVLPYLFSKIPINQPIIVGEGDCEKDKSVFSAHIDSRVYASDTVGIPISATEIAYRAWASKYNRDGEFYFWSSTPGLIKSMFYDAATVVDFPGITTRRTFNKYWQELSFKAKTFNWERDRAINKTIRDMLANKFPNRLSNLVDIAYA